LLPYCSDRPSDAETWLLRRGDPALPRVIQAVRPLVLPKLREENERAGGRNRGKSKKKGVKDIVVEGGSARANIRRSGAWDCHSLDVSMLTFLP